MQISIAGKPLAFSPLSFSFVGQGVNALQQEAGGHRVQRTPPTEKRGRIHTSSVTVAVYPESLTENTYLNIDESDLKIEWFSGTGSGGQHRNKCQNCCRVRHIPSGFIETRQGRSQEVNKRDAILALTQRLSNERFKNSAAQVNALRTSQIGQGIRADKIRTYRERDNIVINHINGKTARYRQVLKGKIDGLWD